MKERKKYSSKFVVLLSIMICLFFGYISIKNGMGETYTDYFVRFSGYFSIIIAVLASISLVKRTFTDLATKRID